MKERLDVLLVSKGFYASREKAKASIMAGNVYIGGRMYDKAGTSVDVDSEIIVRGDSCPFVSRGGMKLNKAIEAFGIDMTGFTAMDIGASTGGFTDCMLQHGAEKVYSVDVGYGQLDWKLRNDPRVVNMEKVNVRYLDVDEIPDRMDFISIDVSFISLKLIFPVAYKLLKDGAFLVCLVKPQFEAGREQVGKKGIVRDKGVHREVIEHVTGYALENHFTPMDLSFSPMTGAKGNIEYLMKLEKRKSDLSAAGDADASSAQTADGTGITLEEKTQTDSDFNFEEFMKRISEVVDEAHSTLDK